MSLDTISCAAIAVHQPSFPAMMSKIVGCDHGAVLRNAQSQIDVMTRAGEVGRALEGSLKQLETLWRAGAAATGAVSTFGQIQGCFGDLTGQGANAGRQIQAAGNLLQTTTRIVQFVQAANAAVAALMSNPFSMAAARALATATTVQTASWLGMLAQSITTIGQSISTIQQATQRTDSVTGTIGQALDPGFATPTFPSATTPPMFPGQSAQTPYPTYGSYPAMPAPQPTPLPAPGTQPIPTGVPNVYNSGGWIPRETAPGTTGGQTAGSGDRITVRMDDPDGDGRYNVTVDAEGELDRDLTISGKIGDQEFNLNVDT